MEIHTIFIINYFPFSPPLYYRQGTLWIFVKFYVYNSYTTDGELYFGTVQRESQNLCYERREKALGDPDPGSFPDNISLHLRFSLLRSSRSGFLFVSSEHADPIPVSETLHLLFLPFQSYLPRACSFSAFEAQLKHPLFKEASPDCPWGPALCRG